MSKLRQIIKLYSQGIGKKKIAQRLGISKNTVKAYTAAYERLRTPSDELLKNTDFELDRIFHPPQQSPARPQVQQLYDFYPLMEKQLRKRGMTIAMQFKAFKALHPEGYGETAFYGYYNKWKKKVNVSMHVEHKVGDKMYVDYAGATLPFVDIDTGEIRKAQVFVAILGWSQYAYVEAMYSQSVEEFIAGSENALHHFNGVPLAVVPDNLKSAVFKPNKYEPELNENFKAFADHYGIAILPARVRKPQDKSLVESMVKIAYQQIYTQLPEGKLFSLEELNQQIKSLLVTLNDNKLTGRDCSRKDQWLMEVESLQGLPGNRFEMRKIKQATVMKNGHVYLTEDQHYYSVPFELIGKKLKLQYTRTQVQVYDQYQLVAVHKRVRSPHNYTTDTTHMPPQHRIVTEWSPSYFLQKAKEIDPVVEHYISQVLEKKQHPQQAYRSCQGILSFAKRVGHQRLIKACKRAHEIGYYSYKTIDDILLKNLDKLDDDPVPTHMPTHENIRGANYYE